ncbi:MAG TPA: LysM peptidoglycan-binding domain-containing protein [Galbitalea sp.]|jgi:nucleoid-associated protein YgaU
MSAISINAARFDSVKFNGGTARRSHLRMTARGRAVLLVLVAIPVIAIALAFGLSAGGATATGSSSPLSTVTVQPGQTLWQVATKVAPQSDPRDVINDIMSVNRLTTATIQPGEKLEIPAKYEH